MEVAFASACDGPLTVKVGAVVSTFIVAMDAEGAGARLPTASAAVPAAIAIPRRALEPELVKFERVTVRITLPVPVTATVADRASPPPSGFDRLMSPAAKVTLVAPT